MRIDTEVSSLGEVEVDQTASTTPQINRFMLEIIIVVLFLGVIFILFPTRSKETASSRPATDFDRISKLDPPSDDARPTPELMPHPRVREPQPTPVNGILETDLAAETVHQDIGLIPRLWMEEMSVQQPLPDRASQALIERVYTDILSTGDLTGTRDLFAQTFTYQEFNRPKEGLGYEAVKRLVARSRSDLTDVCYRVHRLTVDADLVIARWTASGVVSKSMIPASTHGRQMTWEGVTIWRVRYGRVVAAWTPWSSGPYFEGDLLY